MVGLGGGSGGGLSGLALTAGADPVLIELDRLNSVGTTARRVAVDALRGSPVGVCSCEREALRRTVAPAVDALRAASSGGCGDLSLSSDMRGICGHLPGLPPLSAPLAAAPAVLAALARARAAALGGGDATSDGIRSWKTSSDAAVS